MAIGDIKWFAEALHGLGQEGHNLDSDTLKLGIITDNTVPTVADAAPQWLASGATPNFSATQVSVASGYTGPVTLTSVTWTMSAAVPYLRAANVVIPQNAAGFTDGRYAIIYNDSNAVKQCLAFVDLGGAQDITKGSLTFDWSGADGNILSITQS